MILEKVNVHGFPLLDIEGTRTKIVRAPRSEQMFDRIARNAGGRGMKVNQKKTTVLCISDAISCRPEARLDAGGVEIHSSPTLKALGFTFSSSPSVNVHVKTIIKRLQTRTRALSKLR